MTTIGATKMHAGEIETDIALVCRLLAGQFSHLPDLRIDPVACTRPITTSIGSVITGRDSSPHLVVVTLPKPLLTPSRESWRLQRRW
jgi:hypothetical protein